jgi:RHS repeat-associated protein
MRASAIGSFLLLVGMEALAQPGPAGHVPPQLPPQASDKAQEKVAARTAPTVSVTAPAAGALYSAPAAVLLQATASASSRGKSITQVEFFAGTTPIGTVTAAPYTFSWNNVAAGSYSLSARATDNLGVTATSAPVTVIVNDPPSIGMTSPANGAVFTAPASVTLSASAADGDGTVSQVEFFQGSTLLATVTSEPYAFSVNNLPGGAYSFTARATDSRGASVSSAPVAVLVNVAPTITLASPANNATFTAPASITLTADVADPDGTIARVDFFDGMTLIATRTTAPYTIVLTDVLQGAYSLSARVTDNHGAMAASAAVSVTVNSGVAQIYFIHTDHLNTPRLITNNVGQAVWSWNNDDPFGANVPNENPSALGDFTCNLRLPGQYFDRETSLHYNYFRDYEASLGRYVQSDPIGLSGGVNTYAYAHSNPAKLSDPNGLAVWLCVRSVSFRIGNHSYFYDDKARQCCGYPGWNKDHPLQNCPDRERGPGVDSCTLVTTSDIDAKRLFECCKKNANPYAYFPTLNDCQNLTDDCIRSIGMAPPRTPSDGRWMGCDTCWRKSP